MKSAMVLILAVMFMTVGVFGAGGDMGAGTEPLTDGSATYPYLIEDLADFDEFAADPDFWASGVHTKLVCDLNLIGRTYTTAVIAPDTDNTNFHDFDGTPFEGSFDGDGHVISNLTINGSDYLGLFGQTGEAAEIKNLGIEDVNITSGNDSDYLGGLTGRNCCTINNCYTNGSVSGGNRSYYLGGLVGNNVEGIINNCFSNCNVYGGDESENFGGLVGKNWCGTISNCYATGQVQAEDYTHFLGGLIGFNEYGTIINCYSTSHIEGGVQSWDHGGLLAFNSGFVVYSYWDVEISDLTESGGGEGKTTVEMEDVNTFSHWAADPAVWTIDDGNDYPHLAWEQQAGQPINTPLLSVFLNGQGTKDQPYLISDANELELIGEYPNQQKGEYFELISDVNLSSYIYTQAVIPSFSGVLDGVGFAISDFAIDTAGEGNDFLGLFGQIGTNGEVKNLDIEDVNITGGDFSAYIGAMAAKNSGTITDCCAASFVSGQLYLGSVVGWNYKGIVTGCHSTGSLEGAASVGGLVGLNSGTIIDCYSTSEVHGEAWGLGGLVGCNDEGTINSCCSTGKVQGGDESWRIGGLLGWNDYGTISNCYATGSVSGGRYLGGLCGYNWSGTFNNCYTTGSVSGDDYLGGLCGSNNSGTITSSFWDVETSGIGTSGDDNFGAIGKTTDEMQTLSTFIDAGWDFVGERINGQENIWMMTCEGMNYPKLFYWLPLPGDYFCPDGVDGIDLAHLASWWLSLCDETNDYCDRAELSNDDTINLTDFAIFASNWLEGTDFGELCACSEDINCGTDGFVGDIYCYQENCYQDYITFECLNPGTQEAECVSESTSTLIETCSIGCAGGECVEEEAIVYIDGPAYLEEPLILNQPNTYYRLSGDLTTSGDCIIIEADGITLDLNWHTMTGDAIGEDYAVYGIPFNGTTLKNGEIYGFNMGIRLGPESYIININ